MTYLIIIIAIVALLVIVGGGALLLRPRRRGPAAPPPAAGTAPTPAGPAGQTGESGAGGAPAAVLPPAAEPEAPGIEQPPPLAGRLARLRGRLARSQTGFGSVLLGLLSRGTLDDQAWEDIEDTLLTADMGVSPSRQIVEELKTQVRVAGTRNADDVRAMLRGELIRAIGPDMDRSLHVQRHGERHGQDHRLRQARPCPGR